ncbi:helix-turn-helix domain-containing protein [Naasia lichenicola]|uniref:Helix-turn-helix transcriptional regulator n=1 Tax=Naasia lichenicola TaxID=2565933 RepID=A0A4S4FEW5_9MICO|nr:helix-turn-helix transcriptional regulator [Naasia lichenicola]THG28720.1 helix-turn-helix transcriptional regulator [Naasia lichenicola]
MSQPHRADSLPSPAADASPRPPERLWRELVGEQLRGIRQSRGDTLRDVADRASVSPQYLSEIERGFKEPSSEILAAIAASLDRTLLDLTTGVADRLEASGASTRGQVSLAA